ncbi:MAG: 50S ribosomal protein L24 [Stellaceae bacterium]
MPKLKIKKGDNVVVICGRDKGRTGEVLRVFPTERRIVVQGVNVARRHTKPRMGEPGGIIEKELALHISNVAHVDPGSGKPTRIGYRVLNDGRKVRIARGSGEVIDR